MVKNRRTLRGLNASLRITALLQI